MSGDAPYSLVIADTVTELNDSSIDPSTDKKNVSFVDISYTIESWSLFKKWPPKKILDRVRYVY